MRAPKLLLLAVVFGLAVAFAQQSPAPTPPASAQTLTFEVATVKSTAVTDGHWRLQPTPDGYTGTDISLLTLVREAYGVFDAKLVTGGPPWIDRDKFDLEAKFDAASVPGAKNLTYRQRADMLQPLLADRFHLKVHFETKEFPVYDLMLAKDGPKFQQTKPESVNGNGIGITCHHLRGGDDKACSMDNLAGTLHYATGRTVIDKTGLKGLYDYTEPKYSTDSTPADSPNAAYPSIFTAVKEQLGLKLEPSTAPLSILVIDSAEKPSEN